jgi:glycosyltransferase involved in cell wall biosynthesis
MAVHNGADYVGDAVASVLAQTFRDFEFLIVDDGSTDRSASIIASFGDERVRLVTNAENLGLTRSLNRGLELARGELIARQDADDRSHPVRLARQVEFMDAQPDVVVVGSQARFINASGAVMSGPGWHKLHSALGVRWQVMFDSPFVHTAVMFRRSIVWTQHGGYDASFRTSQDYELWSRLARQYSLCNLPETLVDLRLHDRSISSTRTRDNVEKVRALLRLNLQQTVPDYAGIDAWLEMWLSINNQRVYEFTATGADLGRHIMAIHRLFLEAYPAASADPQISRHAAALCTRGALAIASAGRPGALRLAWQAARYNPALTVQAVPKIVGKTLKNLLGRPFSSKSRP